HHLHTASTERNDELAGAGIITHRLPVVSALGAGTRRNPLPHLLLEDVAAISWLARHGVNAGKDVLEHRLPEAKKLVCLAVKLPQDSGFANRKQQLLAVAVDQHALVHFVEIQRFAGDMLEV